VSGDAAEEAEGAEGEQEQAEGPLVIEVEGMGGRVMALPGLSPGSYGGLVPTPDGVLYFSGGDLKRYSLEEREEETILERVRGYAFTPDRSQVLYRSGNDYGIAPVRPGQSGETGRLDLEGMRVRVDPEVEWAQIYHDAWVIMRDFFYDPNLHGVDWDAMYDRYRPLVDHVAHRADLDYVLAELVAEMNVGHAYVSSSPEAPSVDRVEVALLGAEFEADGERYRVANIFPGENWHEDFRSPLTEPGIEVAEGDWLVSIDGEQVTTDDNPYAYLVGKSERTVAVTVSDDPSGRNPRTYDVRPVTSEQGLRYQEWVHENARLVDSLSNGRIGYVHLPNTAVPGHRELYEHFPPQHLKEAMILDDRYNGGGFIPEEMALLVGRPLLNFWARRNLVLNAQPAFVHTGPKAVLINGQSSSGGDAFPYYFRELGLGPLIGERTWGGLVGISGNPGFVDGGSISVPRFAFVDTEGEWAVEGEGVSPDIEVLDRPEQIAAGREPIVERAVQYLLRTLEEDQYERPDRPAGPIRRGGGGGGGGSDAGGGPG
jgi:tricorn protease